MTDQDYAAERRSIVALCRHLAGRGLSPGSSGNVSLRLDDVLLMTPTGSSLSRLTEHDLSVIPWPTPKDDSRPRSGPLPSKELPLHLAAYAARPDIRAVVHLHSPFATALACLPADERGNAALPPLTPYRVMRLGDVPVAGYATPGSTELARGVAELAPESEAILLANHGPVLLGADLNAAADLAEELETAAQVTLMLRGLPFRELGVDEVDALRSRESRRG